MASAAGEASSFSLARTLRAVVPVGALVALLLLEFPLCPSRYALGVPCPGCGLTRATVAFVTGDFAGAMAFHPLMPLITPMVAWMVARMTLVSAGLLSSDSYDPLARLPRWFWWVFMALLFGVWAVRVGGGLGGHPDPVDLSEGWLGQGFTLLRSLL